MHRGYPTARSRCWHTLPPMHSRSATVAAGGRRGWRYTAPDGWLRSPAVRQPGRVAQRFRAGTEKCVIFRDRAYPSCWYMRLTSTSHPIGLHQIVWGVLPGQRGALAYSCVLRKCPASVGSFTLGGQFPATMGRLRLTSLNPRLAGLSDASRGVQDVLPVVVLRRLHVAGGC
jgi:hypothetical protein